VSIVISDIALSKSLGLPLPWLRLCGGQPEL